MKVIAAVSLLCASLAFGQAIRLAEVTPAPVGTPGPRPVSGTLLAVDVGALRAQLAAAPMERLDQALEAYGSVVTLVDPAGRAVDCFVAQSPVMEPALAAKFPEMKTYVVRSLDKTASGRIELTQRGLTGMIRVAAEANATNGGAWMIDIWQSRDDAHAISYWLRDLPGNSDWVCHTEDSVLPEEPLAPPVYGERAVQTRRNYRIAVACTGEYGAHHSALQGNAPNTADPLAAIVTVVARTNVIYEADLGVHFDLVANNELLMFTDGTTDPYTSTCGGSGGTDCSGSILGENPGVLNGIIGSANYDIGHCVTRIFGGVANLRCVCTNSKARGISGIPRGGDADPFSALVVIHEIGHQFGANHTFSGTRGRCFGNVSLNTAWEAGSGSTPMAYAGGCPVGNAPPTDNIVQFADPFFNHGSIIEMQAFLAGNGGNCPQTIVTANQIPTVTVPTTLEYIPPSTPFVLVANPEDADGDVLTVSWEQYDSGFARPLTGPDAFDNGIGSLFRVFPPVTSVRRVFPQIGDVLSGIATPGEMLPTVADAPRRFRALVRDNNPLAGGIAISPFVELRVAPGTTPFTVTSPVYGERLDATSIVVTWTVGGTDLTPINASTVTIDLSTDGGLTFSPIVTTANDGSHSLAIPTSTVASDARIRVRPDGKIFFAVSPRFHIGCPADFNADGGVDGDDVIAYFGLWDVSDPWADLTADGGVDGDDVIAFFGAWDGGC
jgi:hypothetical protein